MIGLEKMHGEDMIDLVKVVNILTVLEGKANLGALCLADLRETLLALFFFGCDDVFQGGLYLVVGSAILWSLTQSFFQVYCCRKGRLLPQQAGCLVGAVSSHGVRRHLDRNSIHRKSDLCSCWFSSCSHPCQFYRRTR